MSTVDAECVCGEDRCDAGEMVPSIHKPLYRHSYQLSIDIDKVLELG